MGLAAHGRNPSLGQAGLKKGRDEVAPFSNHLGNVLLTLTDKVLGTDQTGDGRAEFYQATASTATDYYPFGSAMPGRSLNPGDYRFGFNGKENDAGGEWGARLVQDYGFRLYNPGIGKFLSVDPLSNKSPHHGSYIFAGDNPIYFIDIQGKYQYPAGHDAEYRRNYPKLTNYLENGGIQKLLSNRDIRDGLMIIGRYTEDEIDNLISHWGDGSITIEIKDLNSSATDEDLEEGRLVYGHMPIEGGSVIQIDYRIVEALENAEEGDVNARLFAVVSTILHETTHQGDKRSIPTSADLTKVIGKWEIRRSPIKGEKSDFFHNGKSVGSRNETGRALEAGIWYNDSAFGPLDVYKGGSKSLESLKTVINQIPDEKSDVIPKVD